MENDKQELQFNPESMDCTIRGLESMVGEIAKRPIRMSESAKTFRFDQLAKGGKLVRKRLREPGNVFEMIINELKEKKLKPIVGRMDQMGFRSFLEFLKSESGSEMAQTLSKCEIRFQKGGLPEARDLIKSGCVVGVVTKIVRGNSNMLHFFHLGQDEEGRFTNISDFNPPRAIEKEDEGILDAMIREPQNRTKGWGLVVMKRLESEE